MQRQISLLGLPITGSFIIFTSQAHATHPARNQHAKSINSLEIWVAVHAKITEKRPMSTRRNVYLTCRHMAQIGPDLA